MGIGRLRHKVTIQRPVETVDDAGETITSWEEVETVDGEREHLSGAEWWAAQQVYADLSVRWRVRFRDDVVPKMRLIECIFPKVHTYNVLAVLDVDGRGRWLHILCSEVV